MQPGKKFGGISPKAAGEFRVHATAGEVTGATLEKTPQTAAQRDPGQFCPLRPVLLDCCWLSLGQDESHSAEPSASSATASVPIFPSKHNCLAKHIWRAALTKAGLHLGFRALGALVCVSEAPVFSTGGRKFARDTRHTLMQICNAFFFLLSALNNMFWNIM